MIPWSRSKRKYAKAGEADTVDETNYGAPIEETSFTQVFSSFFGYYFIIWWSLSVGQPNDNADEVNRSADSTGDF